MVLIDRADHNHWTYYLARADTLTEHLSTGARAWIETVGGHRPRNDDSTQTTLRLDDLAHVATVDGWDLLHDEPHRADEARG